MVLTILRSAAHPGIIPEPASPTIDGAAIHNTAAPDNLCDYRHTQETAAYLYRPSLNTAGRLFVPIRDAATQALALGHLGMGRSRLILGRPPILGEHFNIEGRHTISRIPHNFK